MNDFDDMVNDPASKKSIGEENDRGDLEIPL
jgi:hypothetical protein